MKAFLVRFARDESGATAIEYGLIAASIAVVISTIVIAIGAKIRDTFTTLASKFV